MGVWIRKMPVSIMYTPMRRQCPLKKKRHLKWTEHIQHNPKLHTISLNELRDKNKSCLSLHKVKNMELAFKMFEKMLNAL